MNETRYRCTACGNLTRFDVTASRTSRAFHHYTVGGDLVIEENEILEEKIDQVDCRWCGHGKNVEVVPDGEGEAASTHDASTPAAHH